MVNPKFVCTLTIAIIFSVVSLSAPLNVSGQPTVGALDNQLNQTSPLSSVNQTQINGSASANVDVGIGVPGIAATN